jgi:uncharacterized protein YeaO (DUF488 family)
VGLGRVPVNWSRRHDGPRTRSSVASMCRFRPWDARTRPVFTRRVRVLASCVYCGAAGIAVVMITLKRAYEPASPADGRRILVERLWPRGIAKADLGVDEWLKEVAPSTELRKWFRHDPHKWNEFRRRYFRELDSRPNAWKSILSAARRATVTLIYSAHDTEHNNAVALRDFLHAQPRRPRAKKNVTAVRRSRQPRLHR